MIDWGIIVNWIISVVGFVFIVVLAVIYLRSAVRKENHREMEALAKTRGEIIDDLREELEAVKRDVLKLQVQNEVLLELKAEEIADIVARKLNE